jgi:hypothetical protein
MFNIMQNHNLSSGVANYSGLPMLEALGDLTPCWNFPNVTVRTLSLYLSLSLSLSSKFFIDHLI